MFANRVVLVGSSSDIVETAIIDGPTNGRTERAASSEPLRLSIAHGESNENPGFTTRATNIRLTELIELPDSDKTLQAYVQVKFSVPTDHFTSVMQARLFALLANFVAAGENTGAAVFVDETHGTVLANMARLYAGEP